MHSKFNFSQNNLLKFFNFSDDCLRLNLNSFVNKPLFSSFSEIDLSVSNYNYLFYYFDIRQRSQFFWIANQNCFQSSEFLILSFEQPIFKALDTIDWSI